MSLRSPRDQADLEDEDYRLEQEAQRLAPTLSKQRVRDEVDCFLHCSTVGVYCFKFHSRYGNCRERALRAARKIVGIE